MLIRYHTETYVNVIKEGYCIICFYKTLFHRAKKLCSPEVFEIELNVIKEMLIKDGYPNPLIDRVFKI